MLIYKLYPNLYPFSVKSKQCFRDTLGLWCWYFHKKGIPNLALLLVAYLSLLFLFAGI